MPIYEFLCMTCHTKFEELKSISKADEVAKCPYCQSTDTDRLLSLFNAQRGGRSITGSTQGCSMCQSNSCSSCGQQR